MENGFVFAGRSTTYSNFFIFLRLKKSEISVVYIFFSIFFFFRLKFETSSQTLSIVSILFQQYDTTLIIMPKIVLDVHTTGTERFQNFNSFVISKKLQNGKRKLLFFLLFFF